MSTTDEPLETPLAWHIAVLAVAMLLPTAITYVYFLLLSGHPAMQPVYFGGKVVQFALPVVWVFWVQRRRPRLAPPDSASLKWGGLSGLTILALGLPAYFAIFKTSPWLADAPALIGLRIQSMGLTPGAVDGNIAATSPLRYFALAAFLCLPHSLLEEYYYRWFIHGELGRVLPRAAAVLLSSLAFMSHHVIVLSQFFQGQPLAVVTFSAFVAVGGVLWAALYDRTRSLYGPWLSHLLVDAGIMFVGYDLVWGV